jgi:hypothetical protein
MAGMRRPHSLALVLIAALVNLNHPATYVHAGFFQMSVSNLVVIGLMVVVFAVAIALPFRRRHKGEQR